MKNLPRSSAPLFCVLVCLLIAGCSGGASNTSPTPNPTPTPTPTPAAAAPTVTSLSPATVAAGSAALTLTVTGTGYTSSTTLQVGTVVESTTFVSATQVTAAVPATQLAQGALFPVVASNGSSTSASGTAVNLEVDNPTPTITQLVPAAFTSGAAAAMVSVTGTGFVPTTAIQVNNTARATAFVSATQVTIVLTAADLAAAGSLSITAVNPTPMGGTSAGAAIAVNNPVPGVLTLAPATLVTGAATVTTVTVSGTNFLPASIVQVGTSARPTTFVSASQLTFQLSVADQAAAARLAVTVVNPAPGGGTSPVATFVLVAPTPTPVLTQVSPNRLTAGSVATQISIYGSNFISTSVVDWNGSPLATFYATGTASATNLYATVPASLLATAGTASITVNNPFSTPSLSNALTVSITNPPPPTLISLSPSSGPINLATPILLYGSGFTSGSTVSLNGASLAATLVNSTELTVTVPASALVLPGNSSFTVTTPAPGGGTTTTTPVVFTAYIPLVNNSMVFNPVNGLFYASVPSSAGMPYGNSIVSVDPATGAVGTPIQVGSEPNKLALSSDGTILWVGLDGASAVRQVNLTTGTPGLQFTLGGNGGIYQTPATALALAALPGSPNSVVVSSTNQNAGASLAIYDSGVIRGSSSSNSFYNNANALLVDGTRTEVYAGTGSGYYVYTYSATGLTLKSSNTSGNYTNSAAPEFQIANGSLYTDTGKVYDAESGSLLGTFYSSGTIAATGPTFTDTALAKAFVLDNPSAYSYGTYTQIQSFSTSNYNLASSTAIPVSVSTSNNLNYASGLTRWGSNGLAFRTSVGLYSLRSNLVKDLSAVNADLAVTLSAPASGATGSSTTYTATISNNGPSGASNVALTAFAPSSGVLVSVTPSVGACTLSGLSCNLGGIASGSSSTVTFVVLQTASGNAVLTTQVVGSETDPVSTNNQASATVAVTGNAFNLLPTLATLTPAAILSGSSDTTITVKGTGFTNQSTVMLGTTSLTTSFSSSTSLTATVPAAQLTTLGWAAVTVANPAPGGGSSAPLPLSTYSVITLGVNHILYEPFTRKIYASVGSGSSSVTGNSIAAITPDTGAIGTPVYVGSQPTKMAFSDDGNILYTLLGGANSIARFNLKNQQTEFTISPSFTNYGTSGTGFRDVAVQTGSENTIAVDFGYTSGMALIDINPTAQIGTIRGTGTGLYTGTSLHFYDPQTLYLFNTDTWHTLDRYAINSTGFTYNSSHSSSTLLSFGTFQLLGKIGYSDNGGVADVTTTPATQLGIYKPVAQSYASQQVAADPSLQRVFFLTSTASSTSYSTNPDGIVAFDQSTFLPTASLPLNIPKTEGNTNYTGVDLIRWGQDGLAALTNGGHIYLLRGAAVVPQLMNTNSAATLTASSMTTVAHGTGNTILTLTGSNFVPGVAALWNGAYRTTTIVDATHLALAIPAADLATAGTATITANNPGAPASSSLTITIN